MAEVKYVEAIVEDEPVVAKEEYQENKDVELQIGSSGKLARIRYKQDVWPGLERVNEHLEECPLCEVETTRKFKTLTLSEIERRNADEIISNLAYKHKVPKPKLEIMDNCGANPKFGMYSWSPDKDGVIIVCRGGINTHVLAHEFKHHIDRTTGKRVTEPSARDFALKEIYEEKVLYTEKNINGLEQNYFGGKVLENLLLYIAPQWVAKAIERIGVEVDRATGRLALKPHLRPSFYMDLLGTGVSLFLARPQSPLSEKIKIASAIAGGHFSTKMWDFAEEYVGGAALRLTPGGRRIRAGGRTTTAGQVAKTVASQVRFTPTSLGVSVAPASRLNSASGQAVKGMASSGARYTITAA